MKGTLWIAPVAAASLASVAAACILDADGFTGGYPPGPDASPSAAIPGVPTVDGGNPVDPPPRDAGPNLLSNPDFEFGCAGWTTNKTTAVEVQVGRSGQRSCRVCTLGDGGESSFYQSVQSDAGRGSEYVAELWVRALEAGTGDASVSPELQVLGFGSMTINGPSANIPPPGAVWVRTSALLNVTTTLSSVRVTLYPGTVGTCILVDDAALYRTK